MNIQHRTLNAQHPTKELDIDQLIDGHKAPMWVRFFLLMKKAEIYQVPGWQYFVVYKTLFGKNYFIRAYIQPGQHQENK